MIGKNSSLRHTAEQQTKTRTALEYYTAIRDRAHDPAPAGS